jgi:predicted restriction endonuclease
MTISEVVHFVSQNSGRMLPTIGGRAQFSVRHNGPRAFLFTLERNTTRNENHDWIGKSLAVFNQTGSFKLADYPHTQNASYVLGLFWQIVVQQKGLQNLSSGLPIAEMEVAAANVTEQTELRKSRIGQGRYRKQLLSLRKCCYVTGFADAQLLRASHIKPWKDSNNIERLDHFNGLLLTPNYDALFDGGFISFEDDGRICISKSLSTRTITAFGIDVNFQGSHLGQRTQAYVAYHRKEKFLKGP